MALMRASLKPFWLALAALWLAGIAAVGIYPWPVPMPPFVAIAFLVEGTFFLVLGFPAVIGRLSGSYVPFMLALTGVIPYCVYSIPAGVFSLRSFAALAALAALAAFWFRVVPRNRETDLMFLVLVAVVAVSRIFPGLYAPVVPRLKVDFLGQMMWRRVAVLSILLFRPMAGIDLGFLPARREWLIGLREYLFFAPFGAALALGTGFVRFQPMAGDPWRVALVAAGVFIGMFWFVALTEEFFFRGLLQQWLSQRLSNRWAGLMVASLIFGAVHLSFRYPPLNWRFALVATVAGLFYGRAFHGGGVRAAMVTHALVNVTWRMLFV